MKRLTRHTTSYKRAAPPAEQPYQMPRSTRHRDLQSELHMRMMALTIRKDC